MSGTRPQQLPDRLKDYVFVNERVLAFHEQFPNGRILTEMSIVNDNMACFKALVYRNSEDAEPAATGHAIDSIDLKTSTFEKVETAAVGRALAFLNFGAKRSIASREEIEKQKRHRSSPATERETGSQSQTQGVKMIAEAQLTAINNIGGNRHLEVVGLCLERYGVKPEALTFEQASDYIKWLGKQ